jgi:hypothetical protein
MADIFTASRQTYNLVIYDGRDANISHCSRQLHEISTPAYFYTTVQSYLVSGCFESDTELRHILKFDFMRAYFRMKITDN